MVQTKVTKAHGLTLGYCTVLIENSITCGSIIRVVFRFFHKLELNLRLPMQGLTHNRLEMPVQTLLHAFVCSITFFE